MIRLKRFDWVICNYQSVISYTSITHFEPRQCDRIDALKSGKRVRPKVLEEDHLKWQFIKAPSWKAKSTSTSSQPRDSHNTAMDRILQDGKMKRERLEEMYRELAKGCVIDEENEDLCRPWKDEQARVEQILDSRLRGAMQNELNKIKIHVEGAYKTLNNCWSTYMKGKSSSILERQKLLRTGSIDFTKGPSNLIIYHSETLNHLKASYLYYYDIEVCKTKGRRLSGRPWELAMEDLCTIKAKSSDEGKVSYAYHIAQFMQVEGLS
jgi:hypothetical protein